MNNRSSQGKEEKVLGQKKEKKNLLPLDFHSSFGDFSMEQIKCEPNPLSSLLVVHTLKDTLTISKELYQDRISYATVTTLPELSDT